MKKLLVIFFLAGMGISGLAQQDALYNRYIWNGLVLNPAYAGSRDGLSATVLIRKQWFGFKGSPFSACVGVHSPLGANKMHNLGFSAVHDQIGVTRTLNLNFAYAFSIPFGSYGSLSLGIQGVMTNFAHDLDPLRKNDPNDPAAGANSVNKIMGNAGAGIYFRTSHYFVGFSVPEIIGNNLVDKGFKDQYGSLQDRIYLLTGGVMVPFSESLSFRPSILGKYVKGAPPQLDVNLNFLIKDLIWIGAGYRTTHAIVAQFEVQITKNIRFGYAYDYNLNMQNSNSGSHEFMLGFDLVKDESGYKSKGRPVREPVFREKSGKPNLRIDSPRYF